MVIVEFISNWIIGFISDFGYLGIFFLMLIESANIPMPSEVTMPFAGYLVYQGQFSFLGITLAGTLGNLAGSILSYYLGDALGRPILLQYGKYFLIPRKKFEQAENWFKKYGHEAVFIGRLLPVVRTFISLPAGIARIPRLPFLIYSFIGSFIWTYILAYFGMKLGENWDTLRDKLHGFDTVIIILILVGGVWWVYRHFKHVSTSVDGNS